MCACVCARVCASMNTERHTQSPIILNHGSCMINLAWFLPPQDLKGIADQHQTVLIRQEIARHQQEQLRLAEQLRQQEERLGMLGQPMAPLFAPGTGPGEVGAR